MHTFDGIASPDQLRVLTQALQDFCRAERIEPDSPDYDDAAYMIMQLFCSGVASPEEISDALKAGLNRRRAA
jgi:hypothetical protein